MRRCPKGTRSTIDATGSPYLFLSHLFWVEMLTLDLDWNSFANLLFCYKTRWELLSQCFSSGDSLRNMAHYKSPVISVWQIFNGFYWLGAQRNQADAFRLLKSYLVSRQRWVNPSSPPHTTAKFSIWHFLHLYLFNFVVIYLWQRNTHSFQTTIFYMAIGWNMIDLQ